MKQREFEFICVVLSVCCAFALGRYAFPYENERPAGMTSENIQTRDIKILGPISLCKDGEVIQLSDYTRTIPQVLWFKSIHCYPENYDRQF